MDVSGQELYISVHSIGKCSLTYENNVKCLKYSPKSINQYELYYCLVIFTCHLKSSLFKNFFKPQNDYLENFYLSLTPFQTQRFMTCLSTEEGKRKRALIQLLKITETLSTNKISIISSTVMQTCIHIYLINLHQGSKPTDHQGAPHHYFIPHTLHSHSQSSR